MNYGDGWYGGVYVAAMYTQAFVSDDINFVVREALKAIPEQSRFYQTIADVIKWHEMYPDDWKKNWFEIQKKWSAEKGCPDGVFRAFNIDASINAAYIVLGLLYGEGDYGKTIDISTRAGMDSDCNPANAAGILGTMLGYSNIPDYWKQGIDKVEGLNFVYTDMSLLDVYEVGYKHALEMIERNGGKVLDDVVEIVYQQVQPVRFEESFAGLYPVERITRRYDGKPNHLTSSNRVYENTFKGSAIVVAGNVAQLPPDMPDYDTYRVLIDVLINEELVETVSMPVKWVHRKHEIYWNYDLDEKEHNIRLEVRELKDGIRVNVTALVIYSNTDPGPQTYF